MTDLSTIREQLAELFKQRALEFGDFTLTSGKKSGYYLDGKQVTLYAEGLRLVAEGFLELTAGLDYDAVGGMVIGADPIVGAILTAAANRHAAGDGDAELSRMKGFLIRKESKGHGTDKFVEGPVEQGMKVVVIDDVVTTAKSAVAACERIEDFGCKVVHVVGIVDRLEGGAAAFASRGIPFSSLLTVEDLGVTPNK